METRRRILAVAREHMPAADALRVEEIARLADVSVQTVYSQFGSKGGLFVALADEIEKEAGLEAAFEAIWRSRHGEAALRTALDAALRLWDNSWSFIAFTLRARRTDADLRARLESFDKSRLAHLEVICRRLQEERRLADGLTAASAARLAFALTTPYVHEAMVLEGGLSARASRALVIDSVVRVVVEPGSPPVPSPFIDWNRLGLRSTTLA